MTAPRFLAAWSAAEGARRARAGFRRQFGGEAAGVWAAPGRVNLIGEHTDYNGGLSLPIALPHRTYFAARPSPGGDIARLASSEVGSGVFEFPMPSVAPGAVPGWGSYALGVLWALRLRGLPAPALTGHITSCVPFGAGLSSSAALEAAVALAALNLTPRPPDAAPARPSPAAGPDAAPPPPDAAVRAPSPAAGPDAAVRAPSPAARPDAASPPPGAAPGAGGSADWVGRGGQEPGRATRQRLAEACVQAENEIAGAPTGGMDQAAALLAQPGHALLVDSTSGAAEPLPFDLAGAGLELLVIDTRAKHALVDGQYGQRRATCAEAARILGLDNLGQLPPACLDAALARLGGPETVAARRVRHIVTEIDRTRRFAHALKAGRLAQTGPLMDASHASLRDDYEVSSPELDLAVDAARRAGALGARMTGGGFGGSAIALTPAGAPAAVAEAVAQAFAQAGLKPPAFLVVEAAAPASRVA